MDSPPSVPRPTFFQRAFTTLEAAIRAAGETIPELEGAAVLLLYRLPEQQDIPSIMTVGIDEELANPDQLARLCRQTARLQVVLTQKYGQALLTLRELEGLLAKRIEVQRHELRTQEQGAEAAGPERDADDL